MSKKGKSNVINSRNHINQCPFLKLVRFFKRNPIWLEKVSKFQKMDPSEKIWFRWIRRLQILLTQRKKDLRFPFFFLLKIFQHLSTFNIQNVLFINWKLDLSIKWHFFVLSSTRSWTLIATLVLTALHKDTGKTQFEWVWRHISV